MLKRKTWLIGALVASLLAIPVAIADDSQSLQDKLSALADTASAKDDLQGKLNWAIAYKNGLNVELRDLDWQLQNSQAELSRLQSSLSFLEESISDISERLSETEAHQDQIDALAKERLRVLYKNSNMSYLEVLFNSTSYSDFLQRFDLVKKLFESDLTLLSTLQTLRTEQDRFKRQLENDYAEQQRMQQMEIYLLQSLTEKQDEKSSLIDNVQGQQEYWEAALAELEAYSIGLEEEIRILQEKNRGKTLGNGTYIWPLSGYYTITSYFGWRPDPFGGDSMNNHSGLDIEAPTGASIMVVDSGIVIMAETGYNGGYGNMVMVDHGNGIATIYAHCSELLVSNGQAVSQGETIAKVGSSGWSTGPHLHIEFRIDGMRDDPENYLY